MNLRKFHTEESGIFQKDLVVVGRQGAQTFLNEKQLIKFILSRKHWVAVNEFPKYATYSPNVDLLAVGGSHQQFRRTVPARGNVIGQIFVSTGLFQLSRKTEIAYFHFLLIAYQQILWLYIAVGNV
jgi:hypothetical protein